MKVLVTGGTTGIGLAIVRAFEARGDQVAVTSFGDASGIPCDLRDRAQVESAVAQVIATLGRIDVLVNSASMTGTPAVSSFLETTPALLDAIVDTNLKGAFHISQCVAAHMVAWGGGGAIIHIASVGAFAAQEFASVYCATKAAQVMLAKAMALELAPHGIRVNSISPGDIDTQASAAIAAEPRRYARPTPLGRRGTPEEIAAAAVFLASPAASFITGADLRVDGGFLTY